MGWSQEGQVLATIPTLIPTVRDWIPDPCRSQKPSRPLPPLSVAPLRSFLLAASVLTRKTGGNCSFPSISGCCWCCARPHGAQRDGLDGQVQLAACDARGEVVHLACFRLRSGQRGFPPTNGCLPPFARLESSTLHPLTPTTYSPRLCC